MYKLIDIIDFKARKKISSRIKDETKFNKNFKWFNLEIEIEQFIKYLTLKLINRSIPE